jgi:CheY-like chemotaxis protein
VVPREIVAIQPRKTSWKQASIRFNLTDRAGGSGTQQIDLAIGQLAQGGKGRPGRGTELPQDGERGLVVTGQGLAGGVLDNDRRSVCPSFPRGNADIFQSKERRLMKRELKEYELANVSAANRRKLGILIASHMGLMLTLLKLELEPLGFNVWLAVDGDDALDLYRRHRTQIDLVLLEVQMPGMDGPHTLETLQRLNPHVVACFMTENPGIYTEEDLLERGAACVFNEPCQLAEVAHCLQLLVPAPVSTPFVCDWQIPSESKGRVKEGTKP